MSPAELGFRMPPEWALQEAVWLSWPVADPRHWGGSKLAAIEAKFAEIVAAISRFEAVRINAPATRHPAIRQACQRARADLAEVALFDHANDDVWCRDHGPIFVHHPTTGEVAVTNWEFNAWGGKFPPWDADNAIPAHIAKSLGLRQFDGGLVLEGGAIEVNGCRQLLTTEAVLLNPNRNPRHTKAQIEQSLRSQLGVTEVMWLAQGIEGDDTDGHVDDLARFIDDHTLLYATSQRSPNREILEDNHRRLAGFRRPDGEPFACVGLPLPDPCEVPGWRLPILPASYVNFLIINHAILVPTFRQKSRDQQALGLLGELRPDREVIGIDCLELVEEGGSLHCISKQQPAARPG